MFNLLILQALKNPTAYWNDRNLLILWLDIDNGLHKNICASINFPNAEIKSIESFSKHLDNSSEGLEIMNYLKLLKELKGTIL